MRNCKNTLMQIFVIILLFSSVSMGYKTENNVTVRLTNKIGGFMEKGGDWLIE